MTRASALVLSAVLLGGCGETVPATQVVLTVDAEPELAQKLTKVELVIRGGRVRAGELDADTMETVAFGTTGMDARPLELPVRVLLVPRGNDASRRYEVVVSGRVEGAEPLATVVRVVRNGYVRREARELRVVLQEACLGVACAVPDQSCDLGACRETTLGDPAGLAQYRPAEDAGPPLDGGGDAGVPSGTVECEAGGWAEDPPVAITAGAGFTCALRRAGAVDCWGDNSQGALGLGDTTDRARPTRLTLGSEMRAISAGQFHVCALPRDLRAIGCWGQNSDHQAGQPDEGTIFPSIVSVPGTAGARDVAAGFRHTCAVLAEGVVACWGAAGNGRLGRVEPAESSSVATPVAGLLGATLVAAGTAHSCAALPDGIWCWGDNRMAQLAVDAVTVDSVEPVLALGTADPVLRLVAGANHTCAVLAGADSDNMRCWGANDVDQLGTLDPDRPGFSAEPGVRDVAAGNGHTCVLRGSAGGCCWGQGTQGQLGSASRPARSTPLGIQRLQQAAAEAGPLLAAGRDHSCVLLPGGGVACWGDNSTGALGTEAVDGASVPVCVTPPPR